ncbi:hypothetical protein ACPCSP_25705 [Streptomyces cinereoruber]
MWRAKPSKETVEAARRDFEEAEEARRANSNRDDIDAETDRTLMNGGHL